MKKLIVLFVVTLFFSYNIVYSQTQDQTKPNPPAQHGKNFIDNNGDGFNDNAPDHDGDGIPNGVDPDYTGTRLQKNKFVDLDGDGINDNANRGRLNNKANKGGYGSGKGMKNNAGQGPQSGTQTATQTGTQTQTKAGRGYRGGK